MSNGIQPTRIIMERMEFICLLKRYRTILEVREQFTEEAVKSHRERGDLYACEVMGQFAQADADEIELANRALEWVSENLPADDADY